MLLLLTGSDKVVAQFRALSRSPNERGTHSHKAGDRRDSVVTDRVKPPPLPANRTHTIRTSMRQTVLALCTLSVLGIAACSSSTKPGDGFSPGKHDPSSYQSAIKQGTVPINVYLPPGWTNDGTETYPLLMFLYGQGGREDDFAVNVDAELLNRWILDGELEPMVIVTPLGDSNPEEIQWYTPDNEQMLTNPGELRAHMRTAFRAGGPGLVSVQGQSRGAAGALHLVFKYPELFRSSVAMAYVSDYNLDAMKTLSADNADRIKDAGVTIRMEIGTADHFVLEHGRTGTPRLAAHLDSLGIDHEYEVIEGASHFIDGLWFHRRSTGELNGLYTLRLHQRAWGMMP